MNSRVALFMILSGMLGSCSTTMKTTYNDGGYIDDTYHVSSRDDKRLAVAPVVATSSRQLAPERDAMYAEPYQSPAQNSGNNWDQSNNQNPLNDGYSRDFSYQQHFNRLNGDDAFSYRDGYRDGYSDASWNNNRMNQFSSQGWNDPWMNNGWNNPWAWNAMPRNNFWIGYNSWGGWNAGWSYGWGNPWGNPWGQNRWNNGFGSGYNPWCGSFNSWGAYYDPFWGYSQPWGGHNSWYGPGMINNHYYYGGGWGNNQFNGNSWNQGSSSGGISPTPAARTINAPRGRTDDNAPSGRDVYRPGNQNTPRGRIEAPSNGNGADVPGNLGNEKTSPDRNTPRYDATPNGGQPSSPTRTRDVNPVPSGRTPEASPRNQNAQPQGGTPRQENQQRVNPGYAPQQPSRYEQQQSPARRTAPSDVRPSQPQRSQERSNSYTAPQRSSSPAPSRSYQNPSNSGSSYERSTSPSRSSGGGFSPSGNSPRSTPSGGGGSSPSRSGGSSGRSPR